jgi:hypothetical protein
MKHVKVILVLVFLFTAVVAFSQSSRVSDTFDRMSMGDWVPVSGNWKVMGGKLYQTDTAEKMAMVVIPVKQSGKVLYEFDVNYVTGGEDNYGGFGIHICINNPSKTRSWGNGQSFLAWITWDPDTYGWPGGFIQLYQSTGATRMGLFPEGDIIEDGDTLPIGVEYLDDKFLAATITVRLQIDTATGKGYFYDPFDPYKYRYPFELGTPIKAGDAFAFRTNSLSVCIDNFKVSKVY